MGGAAACRRTAATVRLCFASPLLPKAESRDDAVGAPRLRVGSSYDSGPETLMLGRRVREGKAVKAVASADTPLGATNGIVMANLLAIKRER